MKIGFRVVPRFLKQIPTNMENVFGTFESWKELKSLASLASERNYILLKSSELGFCRRPISWRFSLMPRLVFLKFQSISGLPFFASFRIVLHRFFFLFGFLKTYWFWCSRYGRDDPDVKTFSFAPVDSPAATLKQMLAERKTKMEITHRKDERGK